MKKFTLVELVIVVAVVALLAAMIHPMLAVAREAAEEVGCRDNLSRMGKAAAQYATDSDGWAVTGYLGRGIGKALYGALIELLRRQNLKAAYACITQPNDRSMRLHEALGFRTVGVFPDAGFKAGAWRAVGWLRLPLGSYDGAPLPVIPYEELGSEQVDAVLAQYRETLN